MLLRAGRRALDTLNRWRDAQGSGRAFVFCSMMHGVLGTDEPISGHDVYRVILATQHKAEKERLPAAGIVFAPHDARRTRITEALATGTAFKDVQE